MHAAPRPAAARPGHRRAPARLNILVYDAGCCGGEALLRQAMLEGVNGVSLCAAPARANVLLVSGRIGLRMIPELRRLYEHMPEPRWVTAVGACAGSGGPFDTYAAVQGLDRILPVDVYVPGCPPSVAAVRAALDAMRQLAAPDATLLAPADVSWRPAPR